MDENDTIAAAATAPGRAAIGIVRISGPRAIEIAARLLRGGKDPRKMPGFTFTRGFIRQGGETLDEVLCLVMRAPRSYTREDMVEFHCHGGPAAVRMVLDAVLSEGARLARPGEFTRRAFLSGRIDLAQAEAVANLVASETLAAAKAALRGLTGEISERLAGLRERLAETLALLEAGIDFPEEEDVRTLEPAELAARMDAASAELSALVEQARRGSLLARGARVVIAGKPNVGKSTLMNALVRADRVIVTDTPGTTRDVVEERIELSGIPVSLFDTAGLREGKEPAERMGVERARKALQEADLVLFVLDSSLPLSEEDRKIAEIIRAPAILLLNKCDLEPRIREEEARGLKPEAACLEISALHKQGIDWLEKMIVEKLAGDPAGAGEDAVIFSARSVESLERTMQALSRARAALEQRLSDEFIASDLRKALEALGELTGETATDEILDLIFNRFCIGK